MRTQEVQLRHRDCDDSEVDTTGPNMLTIRRKVVLLLASTKPPISIKIKYTRISRKLTTRYLFISQLNTKVLTCEMPSQATFRVIILSFESGFYDRTCIET